MARIVFVRNRSTRKWLALLSTDVDLADEEIIKLYKRRWDIEVFFKITKSYLRLAKEFQSRSYDALVAHTAIADPLMGILKDFLAQIPAPLRQPMLLPDCIFERSM